MNYYIPLHEILHGHTNDYKNLQSQEVHHVMACNYMTITCYYMPYMPLHAPKDANGFAGGRAKERSVTFSLAAVPKR